MSELLNIKTRKNSKLVRKKPDLETWKQYIYRGPLESKECEGEGCSKQATKDVANLYGVAYEDLSPQDAWYKRAAVLKDNGKEIYNTDSKKDLKEIYRDLKVGDFVSLDREGVKHANDISKVPGFSLNDNEKTEHLGYVIGYDDNGVPLIKHGHQGNVNAEAKSYVQPITNISLPDLGLNYSVKSIYRSKKVDENKFKEHKYYKELEPSKDLKFEDNTNLTEDKKKYIEAYNKNAQRFQQESGLSAEEVAAIGNISYGIFGNESTFNESIKRVPKQIAADILYKLGLKDSAPSLGPTQIKIKDIKRNADNSLTKKGKIIDSLGVSEGRLASYRNTNYDDVVKATFANLSENYKNLKNNPENKFNPATNTVFGNVPIGYALAKSWQNPGLKNVKESLVTNDSSYAKAAYKNMAELEGNVFPVELPEVVVKPNTLKDGGWGGPSMQEGGYIDSVLNANKNLDWVKRLYEKNTPSLQIRGQEGKSTHFMESADSRVYPTVVRKPNGKLKYLGDKAYKYADKTKTYIEFPSDKEAQWFSENYKKGTDVLKEFKRGGTIPGSPGFTYARTQNPAPSNGKYAKKTLASAQNGQEMKFYQEGLDWKPKNISQWGGDYALDADQAIQTLTNVGDVMSAPQKGVVKALTGNYQTPSEAMNITNPYGKFAIDTILDPINLVGIGLAGKAAKASTKSGILSNVYKINPFAFKSNPEAYYRGIGEEGYKDALKSGVFRQANAGTPDQSFSHVYYGNVVNGRNRAMDFTNDYMVEVPKNAIKDLRKTDYPSIWEVATKEHVPISKGRILKKDWLQGYKEVSKKQDGGIIEDDRGQWKHPGEITKINSNQITMKGVNYPVLGVSNTGDTQMMYPNQEYSFDGSSVTEIPMMQEGGTLALNGVNISPEAWVKALSKVEKKDGSIGMWGNDIRNIPDNSQVRLYPKGTISRIQYESLLKANPKLKINLVEQPGIVPMIGPEQSDMIKKMINKDYHKNHVYDPNKGVNIEESGDLSLNPFASTVPKKQTGGQQGQYTMPWANILNKSGNPQVPFVFPEFPAVEMGDPNAPAPEGLNKPINPGDSVANRMRIDRQVIEADGMSQAPKKLSINDYLKKSTQRLNRVSDYMIDQFVNPTSAINVLGYTADVVGMFDTNSREKRINEKFKSQFNSDNLFPTVQGNQSGKRGDYVTTGSSFGMFRPDELGAKSPDGMYNGMYYPRMKVGGSKYKEGGQYSVTADELQAIMAAGGEVEFLD